MLLARSLIACEAAGIEAWIVLNKSDLQPAFERAWNRMQAYRDMGLAVLPLCLKNDPAGLQAVAERLAGRLTRSKIDRADEVAGLLARGKSVPQIAAALGCSVLSAKARVWRLRQAGKVG